MLGKKTNENMLSSYLIRLFPGRIPLGEKIIDASGFSVLMYFFFYTCFLFVCFVLVCFPLTSQRSKTSAECLI